MRLTLGNNISKEAVFENIKLYLKENNLRIDKQDDLRPWGGFFVIDEADNDLFIKRFFPHLTKSQLTISGKLSPKILIVGPNKRLSWQYHHRRAEIWKLIAGNASVIKSDTDEEKEIKKLVVGEIIELHNGERHRLIGTEGWGIIAEIWRHTEIDNPSNEDDIIRIQDDFGR